VGERGRTGTPGHKGPTPQARAPGPRPRATRPGAGRAGAHKAPSPALAPGPATQPAAGDGRAPGARGEGRSVDDAGPTHDDQAHDQEPGGRGQARETRRAPQPPTRPKPARPDSKGPTPNTPQRPAQHPATDPHRPRPTPEALGRQPQATTPASSLAIGRRQPAPHAVDLAGTRQPARPDDGTAGAHRPSGGVRVAPPGTVRARREEHVGVHAPTGGQGVPARAHQLPHRPGWYARAVTGGPTERRDRARAIARCAQGPRDGPGGLQVPGGASAGRVGAHVGRRGRRGLVAPVPCRSAPGGSRWAPGGSRRALDDHGFGVAGGRRLAGDVETQRPEVVVGGALARQPGDRLGRVPAPRDGNCPAGSW
jgi:hypothetical protein